MPYEDEIVLPKKTKPKWKPTWKPGASQKAQYSGPSWLSQWWKNTKDEQVKWGGMYGKGQNPMASKKKKPRWNRGRQGSGSRPYDYAAQNDIAVSYQENMLAWKKSQAAKRRAAGGGRQSGKAANPYLSPYNVGFLEDQGEGYYDQYGGYGGGYGGGYRRGGGGGGGSSARSGTPLYFSPGNAGQYYQAQRPYMPNLPRWMALIANWRMSE